ncbi:MAG: SDR family NAD(P)-dependent oxidoreductase [Bryobacteraceae bacterium]
MKMTLEGKVVAITGANGGLGRAVTQAFLDTGATAVGISKAIQASEFAHPKFHAQPADLAKAAGVKALVASLVERFGRIDALVHLVGAFAGGKSVAETEDATLEQMLDANFRSAFYLFREVIPSMRASGGGAIVAIGSRTAVDPAPTLGVYSASKAALVSLVKTVALENKDAGITANIVLPGTMDTPANRAAMPDADRSQWVLPANVAELLASIVSARRMTGAVITI